MEFVTLDQHDDPTLLIVGESADPTNADTFYREGKGSGSGSDRRGNTDRNQRGRGSKHDRTNNGDPSYESPYDNAGVGVRPGWRFVDGKWEKEPGYGEH